jgi:hypothetical protein
MSTDTYPRSLSLSPRKTQSREWTDVRSEFSGSFCCTVRSCRRYKKEKRACMEIA